MKTFLTLDFPGFLLALFFGVFVYVFGGGEGLFFLLVLLVFLVMSAIVTELEKDEKIRLKIYEKSRGWRNVVANGAVPVLVVFAYWLNLQYSFSLSSTMLVVVYVASVASISADKFSSEIGVLSNRTASIITFRKVKQGTSGGVSWLGALAGMWASAVIGLSLFSFAHFYLLLVIVILAGFFGNVVDSILGHFEEKGVGNKYTSNLACAAVGALLSALLFAFYLM